MHLESWYWTPLESLHSSRSLKCSVVLSIMLSLKGQLHLYCHAFGFRRRPNTSKHLHFPAIWSSLLISFGQWQKRNSLKVYCDGYVNERKCPSNALVRPCHCVVKAAVHCYKDANMNTRMTNFEMHFMTVNTAQGWTHHAVTCIFEILG